jgi:hypothetical protein
MREFSIILNVEKWDSISDVTIRILCTAVPKNTITEAPHYHKSAKRKFKICLPSLSEYFKIYTLKWKSPKCLEVCESWIRLTQILMASLESGL